MTPPNTQLAADRTRLALERTLMAWIRTSAALISLGFGIHTFLEGFDQITTGAGRDRLFGSRHFALLMIVIALLALSAATLQHRREIRELQTRYGTRSSSLAFVTSFLIFLLGIFGLLSILFHQ